MSVLPQYEGVKGHIVHWTRTNEAIRQRLAEVEEALALYKKEKQQ
jgi:hypothetical protein